MEHKSLIVLALAVIILLTAAFALYIIHNHAYAKQPIKQLITHYSLIIGIGTHGNESSELKALESGVKYYRTDIMLTKSQEQWLAYEHSKYSANYLGILDYATVPNGYANKNWNLSVWNESVSNAVNSYPYITTWEIWNEPWVSQFQTGYMNGSAYNYFMVIKSAATIIREKEPNATIVCFGGAPMDNYQIYEWYADVWHYGAANYCNAISLHAYIPLPTPLSSALAESWNQSIDAYAQLTHKPIWITEFGMPASSVIPGYSPALQKEFLLESLNLFSKNGNVTRAYWYDLWGLSDGALDNNYGLLNLTDPYNGTPEPAWYSFLQAYNSSESSLAS